MWGRPIELRSGGDLKALKQSLTVRCSSFLIFPEFYPTKGITFVISVRDLETYTVLYGGLAFQEPLLASHPPVLLFFHNLSCILSRRKFDISLRVLSIIQSAAYA